MFLKWRFALLKLYLVYNTNRSTFKSIVQVCAYASSQ